MNLSYRITELEDLEHCVTLTRNHFAFKPDEYPDLVEFWKFLIANSMAVSAVVIDHLNERESRVVGFGMSVFTTDEFADEMGESLSPYLARQIFERWLKGNGPLPILNAQQIKQANSTTGLNIGVIHRGWINAQPELTVEDFEIGPKLYEVFAALTVGYRLNRLQVEVYGEVDRERLQSFGYRCRTDYADHFEHGFPPPPPGNDPFLMELTTGEILQRPYGASTPFFLHRTPKIYYTTQEQQLLQRAIFGESDAEIARSLKISISTVHKRWRMIYSRAEECGVALLPAEPMDVRGPEKRTVLLRYLNQHLEELRPVVRPKDL